MRNCVLVDMEIPVLAPPKIYPYLAALNLHIILFNPNFVAE